MSYYDLLVNEERLKMEDLRSALADLLQNVEEDCPVEARTKHLVAAIQYAHETLSQGDQR